METTEQYVGDRVVGSGSASSRGYAAEAQADRRIGLMEQIADRLDVLEDMLGGASGRLETTSARIFCEPSAVQSSAKGGNAPSDPASLPSIINRVERLLERASIIDAMSRRLAEQL